MTTLILGKSQAQSFVSMVYALDNVYQRGDFFDVRMGAARINYSPGRNATPQITIECDGREETHYDFEAFIVAYGVEG